MDANSAEDSWKVRAFLESEKQPRQVHGHHCTQHLLAADRSLPRTGPPLICHSFSLVRGKNCLAVSQPCGETENGNRSHSLCGFSKQAAPGLTPPRNCTHSDVSITNCLSINFQHLLIPRDQTTSLSGNSVLDKLCPTPGLTQKLCSASLMVQWLRIHLQMWGTQIRALVWEDPTCLGAAKSICANFRIPGRAPRHQRKFG